MENFKPTYLYIKQHKITGKLYFGKTIRDDVESYKGSGRHWKNHYTYHGTNEIETIWYCEFHDQESCTEFALMCSEMWNIVNSKEWLNQIAENGVDATSGLKHSEESKKKIGDGHRGKIISKETRDKISKAFKGKPTWIVGKHHSEETKDKIRNANIGKKLSSSTRQKMSDSRTGLQPETVNCPHCDVVGGINIMKRWHFDTCKRKSNDSQ